MLKATIGDTTYNVFLGEFDEGKILADFNKDSGKQILICGFNAVGEIDLTNEVLGDGENIKRLTDFSKKIGGTFFCGIKTNIGDVKHISVVASSRGKLVDIADRSSNPFGDVYGTSKRLKVFASGATKIGLLVDADCLVEKNWQKTAPHANLIICINRGNSSITQEEVRLYSATYKIPYLYVDELGIEWKE